MTFYALMLYGLGMGMGMGLGSVWAACMGGKLFGTDSPVFWHSDIRVTRK